MAHMLKADGSIPCLWFDPSTVRKKVSMSSLGLAWPAAGSPVMPPAASARLACDACLEFSSSSSHFSGFVRRSEKQQKGTTTMPLIFFANLACGEVPVSSFTSSGCSSDSFTLRLQTKQEPTAIASPRFLVSQRIHLTAVLLDLSSRRLSSIRFSTSLRKFVIVVDSSTACLSRLAQEFLNCDGARGGFWETVRVWENVR
jgi:hypothetical protein